MQRVRYRNPPIIEALIEFRFQSGADWNPTLPGKLHGLLEGAYDGAPREQQTVQAQLTQAGASSLQLNVAPAGKRSLFPTRVNARLVAVGPNVLSVHMLAPYEARSSDEPGGWEEFRKRVVDALEAYWRVGGPEGVVRVGMRYINQLVLSEQDGDVATFLRGVPERIDGMQGDMASFFERVEYKCEPELSMLISHVSLQPAESQRGYLLDIDLSAERTDGLNMSDTLTLVDTMRALQREGFEQSITDKAREKFNEP